MKVFELWLDESGDFNEDYKKVQRGYNPSFIGGVLVEKGKISSKRIEKIIPKESFHCRDINTKEGWEEQFLLFREIVENDLKIVMFNNEECIMIIDSTTTYKNIMVEGIIKLIEDLQAKYRKIKLEILLDKRRDTTKEKKTYIDSEEYIKRIEEKITLTKSSISKEAYCVRDASAENNKFLMIADIVCNTILTRNTQKFSGKEQEYINEIYINKEKTIIFPVLRNLLKSKFYDLMGEGLLGEAVAILCQSNDEKIIEECMRIVAARLKEMPNCDIEFQYNFIKWFMQYNLNVEVDYGKAIHLAENLLKYFLPVLQNYFNDSLLRKIELDIKFYMLTLYTHMGNVSKAKECISECDTLVEELGNDWKFIEYRIQYVHRRIINKINMFDFEKALQEVEELVTKCQKIKEAIEIWVEDDRKIRFDELAKAYGSQVQIYTFLLRKQPDLYQKAVSISEDAINEFDKKDDKERQYIYRSQLETENKKYDIALEYLFKANGLSEDVEIKELVKKIEGGSPYARSAYLRLMAESSVSGWKKAETMYDELSKSRILHDDVEKKELAGHPYEIILWKWGSYEMTSNRLDAGTKKLEKAIKICFQKNELTLHFIGLAILLEEYAIILRERPKEQKNILKKLKKRYDDVYSMDMEESMKIIYEDIEFSNSDWEYFYKLSRKITY